MQVIPGSHKLDIPDEELVEMVRQDPSMVHSIVAPAGSTLLFGETLVHATGQIQSDAERTILTSAYGPPMFPYWDDGVLQDDRRLQEGWMLTPAFRSVPRTSLCFRPSSCFLGGDLRVPCVTRSLPRVRPAGRPSRRVRWRRSSWGGGTGTVAPRSGHRC